jgi:hypothetical protein
MTHFRNNMDYADEPSRPLTAFRYTAAHPAQR